MEPTAETFYDRVADVSLLTLPRETGVTRQQLEQIYAIVWDIVINNFGDRPFFRILLRTYVREKIDEDRDMTRFFEHYNNSARLAAPILRVPDVMDLFDPSPSMVFTEERVDQMVNGWVRRTEEELVRVVEDFKLKFDGHTIKWRRMDIPGDPFAGVAMAVLDIWPEVVFPIPGPDYYTALQNVIRILRMHVSRVRAAIHETFWAVRAMFLTLEWRKYPRVDTWEMAWYFGVKVQAKYERHLYVSEFRDIGAPSERMAKARKEAYEATLRLVEETAIEYGAEDEGLLGSMGGFFMGKKIKSFVF